MIVSKIVKPQKLTWHDIIKPNSYFKLGWGFDPTQFSFLYTKENSLKWLFIKSNQISSIQWSYEVVWQWSYCINKTNLVSLHFGKKKTFKRKTKIKPQIKMDGKERTKL